MDQPIDPDLALNGYVYQSIRPSQVTHRLTDDGFSHFDLGPWRVAIRTTDLTQVRAARQLAQAVGAQAGFWDGDLAAVETRLIAERDVHLSSTSAPGENPAPAPEPTPDNPFDEDDPELDAAVARVADMPETHRKPKATTTEDKS